MTHSTFPTRHTRASALTPGDRLILDGRGNRYGVVTAVDPKRVNVYVTVDDITTPNPLRYRLDAPVRVVRP